MNSQSSPQSSENEDLPLILAIALQISKLCFPDRIYTGKVISDRDDINDCELLLLARTIQGDSIPQASIKLEVVKVGARHSITAEYSDLEALPILWQGEHAVWMDGDTGKTVSCPPEGRELERLARGILKRLESLDERSASG